MAGAVIIGAGPGIGTSVALKVRNLLGCRWGSSRGRRRPSTRPARPWPRRASLAARAAADAGQDDQLTAALDALTGNSACPRRWSTTRG